MIILGLSGKARTGKSTLCTYLWNAAHELGWVVSSFPFAGPLKKEASDKGYTKESNPKMYREYCQSIGAKKRQENPDHWTNLWFNSLKNAYKEEMEEAHVPVLYLVDDVRYDNEIKLLNKIGAVTCFVKHLDREIEDPKGAWRDHESEKLANTLEETKDDEIKQTLKYNFVVHNNKEPEELKAWASDFIKYISAIDPCLCESCMANFEMREPNVKKLDEELKEFMDDVLGDDDETS